MQIYRVLRYMTKYREQRKNMYFSPVQQQYTVCRNRLTKFGTQFIVAYDVKNCRAQYDNIRDGFSLGGIPARCNNPAVRALRKNVPITKKNIRLTSFVPINVSNCFLPFFFFSIILTICSPNRSRRVGHRRKWETFRMFGQLNNNVLVTNTRSEYRVQTNIRIYIYTYTSVSIRIYV